MKVEDILNLQYRKLLTAKDEYLPEYYYRWDNEEVDIEIPLALVMSMFLIDLENVSKPLIDVQERTFLTSFLKLLEEHPDGYVRLPYHQRLAFNMISSTNVVDDEMNKTIALAFTDYVNQRDFMMMVGKKVIEDIFN